MANSAPRQTEEPTKVMPPGLDWRERNAWLEENGRQCSACKHNVGAGRDDQLCLKWSKIRDTAYSTKNNQAPWCQFYDVRDQRR